jgi:tRNA(fMet)-specific endonuclease VapC
VPNPIWVLDTDHLSFLQYAHPLVTARLRRLPANQRTTTIVNVEEQLRGRFAKLASVKKMDEWVPVYRQFQKTLTELMPLRILPFDDAALPIFQQLKATIKHVGTQDLKIAAITLSVDGVLVTRNAVDFSRVPNLTIEDWTQP